MVQALHWPTPVSIFIVSQPLFANLWDQPSVCMKFSQSRFSQILQCSHRSGISDIQTGVLGDLSNQESISKLNFIHDDSYAASLNRSCPRSSFLLDTPLRQVLGDFRWLKSLFMGQNEIDCKLILFAFSWIFVEIESSNTESNISPSTTVYLRWL